MHEFSSTHITLEEMAQELNPKNEAGATIIASLNTIK